MKRRLTLLCLGLAFLAGTAARAYYEGRALLTPCGPRVVARCSFPGCPCPGSSHTHVMGDGTHV